MLLTAEAWQDISGHNCNQYATAIGLNRIFAALQAIGCEVLKVRDVEHREVFWWSYLVAEESATRSGIVLVVFLNRAAQRL